MSDVERPRAFISYSWTSEKHKSWVLRLAEQLRRQSGVDVILDIWHLKPGQDRFYFMENSVATADKVLMICDRGYCDKANGRRGGVGTEAQVITPGVYNNTEQTKFIPIALVKEGNDYLLPLFLKSKFAIWMGDDASYDSAYDELAHLVWGYSRTALPDLGDIPSFVLERGAPSGASATSGNNQIIDDSDEERVLWLLPRGFLLFRDITFSSSDSWAVTASYYNYRGEWQHGTHYHDSYSRQWDENIEVQYQKLDIPEADWLWCRGPLSLLQELRDTEHPIDIKERVERERTYMDEPVFYFAPSDPILLPDVPKQYSFYFKSGAIRDIIKRLNVKRLSKLEPGELNNLVRTARQDVYLECEKFLGRDHPSMSFIKEALDEFQTSWSRVDIIRWCDTLAELLANTVGHERESMRG